MIVPKIPTNRSQSSFVPLIPKVCESNQCSHDSLAHRNHVNAVLEGYGFPTNCVEQETRPQYYEPEHRIEDNFIPDEPERETNSTLDRRFLKAPVAESRKFLPDVGVSFLTSLSGSASSLFGSDGPLTIRWLTNVVYTLNSNTFRFVVTIT